MKGRVNAVCRDHAINEFIDELIQRLPFLAKASHNGQHVVEVAVADGVDKRKLVREVLVERSDADARNFSDLVGGEARPTMVAQNASPGANDDLDGGPGARLAWLFTHRRPWPWNASRHLERSSQECVHRTHILEQEKDTRQMSSLALLRTLFNYRAWANAELLEKMEGFDADLHELDREAALRLLNHTLVVDQIFAAHLVGIDHGLTADNTTETPLLQDLRVALTASDQWYGNYLETVTTEQLSESIPFVFTDGDKGSMSREEMLIHLVTHSGYHRGEVGRIMSRLSLPLPWDTFAVYLHRTEPSRRLATRPPAARIKGPCSSTEW